MPSPFTPGYRQHGFSLPEIMVGVAIGMLGIIIIMQVASFFDGQRRTTTNGDDAQNGAAITLHELRRDIEQAGYGISTLNQIDPIHTRPYLVGFKLVTPNLTIDPLAPVIVNPPTLAAIQDAGSDALLVIYGDSNNNGEGTMITNSVPDPYQVPNGAAAKGVAGAGSGGTGFTDGDWVTVDDGQASSVLSTTKTHYLYQVSGVDANNVPVVIPAQTTEPYAAVPNTLSADAATSMYPILFNLGPTPTISAYAVIGGALRMCDYLNKNCADLASWTPLLSDVATMRAVCEGNTGIRIAIVARNVQPNVDAVTTAVPTWHPNGAATPVVASPATTWPSAQLGGKSWDHFRYKTSETYTPIRNAVWAGVQGCY